MDLKGQTLQAFSRFGNEWPILVQTQPSLELLLGQLGLGCHAKEGLIIDAEVVHGHCHCHLEVGVIIESCLVDI